MEFRDLKTQYRQLKPELDEAIAEVVATCNFIGGQQVKDLEAALAAYIGVKHCITCGNGTDALTLALMAWAIGPGDAVFVPDFTFFASGEVVSHVGATPIFVDVRSETFNLDAEQLEQAVQRVLRDGKLIPKAIIPVDLFGLPGVSPAVAAVAKRYGLKILEDGAQGFGGTIGEQVACSFGDAATTSFFPAKPLGCYGDGGAIFTNDDGMAALLRSYCVHGKGENKYDNVRIGLNSRLDTLQAAVLLVKLKVFSDYELNAVKQAAAWYTQRLEGVVSTPVIPEGYGSSWAQYTIRLKNAVQRDAVQTALKATGIPTMVYYSKPMHRQTAFAAQPYLDNPCPVAERLCDTVLSLPIHPCLTEEQVEIVCQALKEALAQ